MTMSSQQLENLIAKFPRESEAIARLNEFIVAEEQLPMNLHVFTINRLIDKIMPESLLAFSEILSLLEKEGVLRKIFRIESPTTKAGINDYSSFFDIPDVIHDPNIDQDIKVKTDDVKLLYSVVK